MASSRWVLSGWIRSTEPEPSSNSITWIGQRAGVTQRLLTNLKLLGMQDSFGSILVSLVWNNCSILTYAENYEFGTLKSTVFIRNNLNWQNSLSYWDSRWFVTLWVCQDAFKTCATYVRVLVDYKEKFLLFKMPNIYTTVGTTSAKTVILTHNTNTTVLGGRWAAFMSMTFGGCKNISAPLHPLQCWYIIINLQILHWHSNGLHPIVWLLLLSLFSVEFSFFIIYNVSKHSPCFVQTGFCCCFPGEDNFI